MKVTRTKLGWYGIAGALLAIGFTRAVASHGAPQAAPASQAFFPVAVWYGGGKARALLCSARARGIPATRVRSAADSIPRLGPLPCLGS